MDLRLVLVASRRWTRILSLCLVAAAPAAARADGERAPTPDFIDRPKITQELEQAAALIKGGAECTPLETLVQQLDRQACSVPLARGSARHLTAPEVYARARDSVLIVAKVFKCTKCPNWHCNAASGFVISADGVVVTNYHVVNGKDPEKTIVARDYAGHIYLVKEVLAASKLNDVAVIKLQGATNLKPLALDPGEPVGSNVYIISHPNGQYYHFSAGAITQYRRDIGAEHAPVESVDVSAEYGKGSSGGPVLNDRAEVVGMVSSTTSLYYEEDGDKQKNLQMVFRRCVPAQKIVDLVTKR